MAGTGTRLGTSRSRKVQLSAVLVSTSIFPKFSASTTCPHAPKRSGRLIELGLQAAQQQPVERPKR
jgi:hypothetical protein